MANKCFDYCNSDPLGTADVLSCGDPVGGMSAGILLECNHQLTDPSNAAQINAEIAAGRAHKIQRASFTIDAASAVTQDSLVPCETQSLVTYERKGSYKNPNISQNNVNFHDRMFDGRGFGGLILFECGSDSDTSFYVTFINSVVKFHGSRLVGDKNTEFQRFEGEFSWRSKHNPQRYPAPAGVFN